ncbi:MAG: C1 family peptidase [Saprospiraceae bacterium]
MKKALFCFLLTGLTGLLAAQSQEPYEFKEVKNLACTPVKSQDQTGTCWAFSTTSFLESEALRLGKGQQDLSEMFVVRNIYHQKCDNYVRRQGHAQFGEGGLAHDELNAVRQYGLAPESAYPGRKNPNAPYNHSKMEKNLQALCDDFVAQAEEGKLALNWIARVDSVLDAEFGKVPLKFVVGQTEFTPISYRDYLGINPDDYVTITSFTHHPFYSTFVLEVPDNWSNGLFYNLPISDLMRCANNSIQQGYTVEWDADVSNNGFAAGNGMAIVSEKEWKDKDAAARGTTYKIWEKEKLITQDYRQQLFDRQETMDDHLMHVVGIVDEKHNGLFYIVKNSWGEISDRKGYVYVSEPYMRLNTISFTVSKNAIPQDLRRQLGIEMGEVNIEGRSGSGKLQPRQQTATPNPSTRIRMQNGETAPKTAPSKNGSDN